MRRDHHSSRQGAEWGSPLLVDRVLRAELLRLRSGRRSGGSGSRAPTALKGGRA